MIPIHKLCCSPAQITLLRTKRTLRSLFLPALLATFIVAGCTKGHGTVCKNSHKTFTTISFDKVWIGPTPTKIKRIPTSPKASRHRRNSSLMSSLWCHTSLHQGFEKEKSNLCGFLFFGWKWGTRVCLPYYSCSSSHLTGDKDPKWTKAMAWVIQPKGFSIPNQNHQQV